MRNTKGTAVIALLILLAVNICSVTWASIIYDADFNDELLGPLATQPGSSPLLLELPTSVIRDPGTRVDVVDSVGNLLDKPVLLDSVSGGLASAAFYNPFEYSSGIWQISWDSLVLSMPVDTRPEQGNVHIVQEDGGSLPGAWGLKYNTNGSFLIKDATGFHSVGSFSVGTSDHFDLYLDLDNTTYGLAINSLSVLNGTLIAPGEFLHTYFRSNGRGLGSDPTLFAFDNLKVESIPEPTTFILLGLGTLVSRKRRF